MNLQENAKRMLPIYQALAEGKTIQFRALRGQATFGPWKDFDNKSSTLPLGVTTSEYRVKPEPQVVYLAQIESVNGNQFSGPVFYNKSNCENAHSGNSKFIGAVKFIQADFVEQGD